MLKFKNENILKKLLPITLSVAMIISLSSPVQAYVPTVSSSVNANDIQIFNWGATTKYLENSGIVDINNAQDGDIYNFYKKTTPKSKSYILVDSIDSSRKSASVSQEKYKEIYLNTQLNLSGGSLYVSKTSTTGIESDPVEVTYTKAVTQIPTMDFTKVKITNNVGANDILEIPNDSSFDSVYVFNTAKSTITNEGLISHFSRNNNVDTSSGITIPLGQLGVTAGTVYVSLTYNSYETDRTPVKYKAEVKSASLNAKNIKTINNKDGVNDTIDFTNLTGGDIIRIYANTTTKAPIDIENVALNETTTSASISNLVPSDANDAIKEKGGKVYISVQNLTKQESTRIPVSYTSDRSITPITKNFVVTNNTGNSDNVNVSNLTVGDIVTVYDSTGVSALLQSSPVTSTSTNCAITLPTTIAGKLQVSITSISKRESKKTIVSYGKEPK